ncbi:hypothetical protein H5410_002362 [Solanum commersonii]|uniref:DUF7746 domain-containing protein n=1 Tax=Solanum commersonii TaxID=4109 RepID=A0A9J6B1J1_SOLCO|nr:hypothetical protein H5410_002362 [Solanum commersonii]
MEHRRHLDLLNKWTIPKISPRIIYQMGTFEKLGLKQVVKTTEETITIDSDNQTFRLFSKNDLAPYRDIYHFMHIDLVQVAFKPLTLRGLPESFLVALRDGRNYNWKKSLIGTIQTSLAYGPISLQDENSLSSLMLNVKLHSYDYIPSIEVVCICYRIYYKLLHTLNPMCKIIDFKNETILIETNFDKSKVVIRRPIKWEEIDFLQEWVIESATQPRNNINTEISEVEQLNDGTVKIRFSDPMNMPNITTLHVKAMIKQNNYANIYMSILGEHIFSLHDKVNKLISLLPTRLKGKEKVAHGSLQPPLDIDNFKIKDYSDFEDFLAKKFRGGGLRPLNISKNYARKPFQRMYYYPRPTPQDVLLEEHEHIITNSYNGKKIYEWNIDGYTDRQIYTTIH